MSGLVNSNTFTGGKRGLSSEKFTFVSGAFWYPGILYGTVYKTAQEKIIHSVKTNTATIFVMSATGATAGVGIPIEPGETLFLDTIDDIVIDPQGSLPTVIVTVVGTTDA